MHRCGQLPRIELLPRALVVADEVAAAPPAKHFRLFDTGRQHVVVAQRARRHQQAPAGVRDHLVRRRQVLEGVIGDRPHALGDSLVLQMDAIDPAIDRVAALGLAVHSPVVAFVGGEAKATEPFRGVRQEHVAASGAADQPAVLEGGLRLRLRRNTALPAQERPIVAWNGGLRQFWRRMSPDTAA
jgi:hypothetical protein